MWMPTHGWMSSHFFLLIWALVSYRWRMRGGRRYPPHKTFTSGDSGGGAWVQLFLNRCFVVLPLEWTEWHSGLPWIQDEVSGQRVMPSAFFLKLGHQLGHSCETKVASWWGCKAWCGDNTDIFSVGLLWKLNLSERMGWEEWKSEWLQQGAICELGLSGSIVCS